MRLSGTRCEKLRFTGGLDMSCVAVGARCLVIVLIALVLGGCGCAPQYGDNTSLSEISKLTGLRFPAGAKLVHGQNTSFEDSGITAKIEMNRADLGKFLASVPSQRAESRTDRLGITDGIVADGLTWWDPDSSKHFIAIRIERLGQRDLFRILVGLDDPDRAVVYVDWSAD